MIKSPEIKVSPNVLKTIRESSGYTVEEIAKKIKTTVTKVQEADVKLLTIHPLKEGQKEKRVQSGRWRKI